MTTRRKRAPRAAAPAESKARKARAKKAAPKRPREPAALTWPDVADIIDPATGWPTEELIVGPPEDYVRWRDAINADAVQFRALAMKMANTLAPLVAERPSLRGVEVWAPLLVAEGANAVLEALFHLLALGTTEDFGTNVASALGNLLASRLRERVVLAALRGKRFHMTEAAKALGLVHGAPAISRMIDDLGLRHWYNAGKAREMLRKSAEARPAKPR